MKILERRFLATTTPSVHAATIAFYKDHPVFAWFGGSREGNPDVAIYLCNLNNDMKSIVIGDKDLIPRWNPILVTFNNKLIMFEKYGAFCDRWQTFVHNISDWPNDITKKEIVENAFVLPAGLNGPVKSCPLIFGDHLICGSSVETLSDWTSYIESYRINDTTINSLEFISRSNPLHVNVNKSYQDPFSGQTCKSMGIIQPSLWRTGSIIHAFMRSSRGLGKIYYSKGYVGFSKWNEVIPTNLDNPNSAVDVVYHKDRLFLIHNPDSMHRRPLVLSEITMDGKHNGIEKFTIIDQIIITDKVDEKFSLISSELSYPYMIEHEDKLHLVYTYARTNIEYVTIEI